MNLYGGEVVCIAEVCGSDDIAGVAAARAKTAPGEKLRLVLDAHNPARPVLVELLGSFTCGNPYEEDVALGWISGDAGDLCARLIRGGARLFGAVLEMDEGRIRIAVVKRDKGLVFE
ncbi:MAG TPA: hypothetical protein O0X39_01480 [Methanocorpusculum sp.]|nr:hypothetical protein [Methanocorpusculum sp.]